MKKFVYFTIVIGIIVAISAITFADTSVGVIRIGGGSLVTPDNTVDDFNDGANPTMWGGDIYVFDGGNGETIGYSYDDTEPYGELGYCLKINYNVPNSGNWAGCSIEWTENGALKDLSEYRTLEFIFRGNPNQNCKIEMKDSNGKTAFLYLSDYLVDYSTDWHGVRIPFDGFANFTSSYSMTNMVTLSFIFEHDSNQASGYATSGEIFIDNLTLEFELDGIVHVDHFGDNWGLCAMGGDVADMTEHTHSYDTTTYHNNSRSLASNYDITTSGWCGLSMKFGQYSTASPHNFAEYDKLTVWLKANSTSETPTSIKIELVDNSGTRVAYIPNNTTTPAVPISTSWQKYTIYFMYFSGLDVTTIKQMNIVYDANVGTNTTGKVFFDEIQFEQ